MPRRASTPTIIVVNPDGTVGAVFSGDVVARSFVSPAAGATPRVEADAAGFRVILADGSTAVNLGSSALFTGDLHAHALYAPDDTTRPRLEVDANGLRAILANGSEGARIVSNTPRPLFVPGLVASRYDPLFAGTLGFTGGGWQIATGGDEVLVTPAFVPKGAALVGWIGASFFISKLAGMADYGLVVAQAETTNLATTAVTGKAGPATIVELNRDAARSASATAGAFVIAPFEIDNTAGASDLNNTGIALRATGLTPSNISCYERTGIVMGMYG